MIPLQVIEFQLEAEQEEEVLVRTNYQDFKVMILVEQMDDEYDEQIYVQIENLDGDNLSQYDRVKVFIGRVAEGAGGIFVRMRSRVGGWLRVSILRIRQDLSSMWSWVRCRGCKKAVALLLSTALALIGIPYLDANFTITSDILEHLEGVDGNESGFREVVETIDLGLWVAIKAALEGLESLTSALDDFYESVCQRVGLCS
jgi:hypothetical protein